MAFVSDDHFGIHCLQIDRQRFHNRIRDYQKFEISTKSTHIFGLDINKISMQSSVGMCMICRRGMIRKYRSEMEGEGCYLPATATTIGRCPSSNQFVAYVGIVNKANLSFLHSTWFQ